VFEAMLETGKDPGAIVEERGLRQVTGHRRDRRSRGPGDGGQCRQGGRVPSGKDKLFGFFVGQVMKAMQGKGNPALVNEAVKKGLG
jgi:aspartyl-tRNA(Asn)/glutamyl-tRNA(Gln) amidotransferase subunit B